MNLVQSTQSGGQQQQPPQLQLLAGGGGAVAQQNRRIICVDDEPNVLSALERVLSEDFDVTTSPSGEEALKLIATGDFAVIVSDMRMPAMTGAVLLAKVKASHPGVVRILLTGDTDVSSAIAAVNEGEIFRFLTKPCASSMLRKTLKLAIEHHALLNAERELLDGTLRGVVKVMADVLALVSPGVFARATRIKSLVTHVVKQLKLEDAWMYEVAAVLSPIGCIALPEDLVARSLAGQEVTEEEKSAFESHPETAYRLLAEIPRFEKVAAMVRAQHLPQIAVPKDPKDVTPSATMQQVDPTVAMGITLLRAAIEVDDRVSLGSTHKGAVAELRVMSASYPSKVLAALETFRVGHDASVKGLPVAQLAIGMITDEDVLALSGSVIVPKNTELGAVTLERLRKFALGIGVREPVRVRVNG